MNIGASRAMILAAFLYPAMCPAQARISELHPGPAISATRVASEVRHELRDPQTGYRWLLMGDPQHPGGPGRLIAMPIDSREVFCEQTARNSIGADEQVPMIRAGDHVSFEETTSTVEARLEAVALGSAVLGSQLNIRLVLGGKVLRAIAIGPGRVTTTMSGMVRP